MQQTISQLGNLPINLHCLENGQVAFTLHQKIPVIFDTSPSGLSVVISSEDIVVGELKIMYNTATSLTEDLKGWIRSFNLVSSI